MNTNANATIYVRWHDSAQGVFPSECRAVADAWRGNDTSPKWAPRRWYETVRDLMLAGF